MAVLPAPVALFDVDDAEAFVQATINRSRILLSLEEREELVCEGLAILQKLARDYQPHIAGHAQDGRFSGYAAMYLPRKLGDAWHRLHPEHRLVTELDGKRRWHYGEKAVSLEAFTAGDPDRHDLLAAPAAAGDIASSLSRALWEDADRLAGMTMSVARLRARRFSDEAIASELGLDRTQVRERLRHIEGVAPQLRAGVSLVDALRDRARGQIDLAVGVGGLLADGCTQADVSVVLELDPGIVRDCVLMIARVRARLESFANAKEDV